MIVLSASLAVFLIGAGVALGYFTGYGTAVARRAWKDYKVTKGAVPGMRKTAWKTTRLAAGWVAAVVVIAVIAFMGVVHSGDEPRTPASVPSVAPS